MKNTIRFIVLLFIMMTALPNVIAVSLSASANRVEIHSIIEVCVVSLVLFFCIRGLISCIKGEGYNNFSAKYHTEKMNEHLFKNDLSPFEIESAKRVKELMETRKKSQFIQGSTINQLQKNKKQMTISLK